MHALTKYPSGGGDVLMGSIVTRDEQLHLQLKLTHMRMGWGIGGNDAEAILRSLPSLALRYQAHDAAARAAGALARRPRPEIAQVLHPALRRLAGPRALAGAVLAARAARAWRAGLFSVVFDERYSSGAGRRLLRRAEAVQARLFLGRSGEPGGAVRHRVHAQRPARTWPHKGMLVRFSVGLEAVEDLRADLEQALGALA